MDENLHYLHATLPTSDYRAEIARLNVEVQQTREAALMFRYTAEIWEETAEKYRKERDAARHCHAALQSLLDDMTLELTDVNGQLQQTQVTCNRLQDRDNYREWCHRLLAHIKTFDPYYNPDREFTDDVAATEVPGKCGADTDSATRRHDATTGRVDRPASGMDEPEKCGSGETAP